MIYVIEDDSRIRELVLYALEGSGYEAGGFACGVDFFRDADLSRAELLLLDIMLPGENGLAILKRLRSDENTRHLPVIMMTAMGSEYDVVTGLDSGADDYITKPFGMKALLARVRALLRRTGEKRPDGELLRCGSLELDPASRRVTAEGCETALTLKEFELLRQLMEHQGQALSRERLLEAVWGIDCDIETRTLDVHIRTLRQKLGSLGGLIETVRGVGYRMGELQ